MLKIGDSLPTATLYEVIDVATEGCSLGPNPVDAAKAAAGKTIALFALPGAYTPTCSAQHVPGYVENWARSARCACWGTAAPISPGPPA